MLTTMTCPYDVTSSPSATRATGSILLVSIIDQPSRVRPTKTMKVRSRSTTPNPTGAAPATTAVGPRELLHNPLQARLAPPPMEQLIACELLAEPMELLRDRRDRLRAQRDHLAALLEGTDEWSFTLPAGGLCLWLRLHGTTAAALATRAADRGLKLSPGPAFSADRTLTHYLRLPYTATPETLTRAVAALTGQEPTGQ